MTGGAEGAEAIAAGLNLCEPLVRPAEVATRPRTGKPMTPLLGCQTSWMATAPPGTIKVRGPLTVVAAARGEKVDEMIQGDLVGSRVSLHNDARPGDPGWPVVH